MLHIPRHTSARENNFYIKWFLWCYGKILLTCRSSDLWFIFKHLQNNGPGDPLHIRETGLTKYIGTCTTTPLLMCSLEVVQQNCDDHWAARTVWLVKSRTINMKTVYLRSHPARVALFCGKARPSTLFQVEKLSSTFTKVRAIVTAGLELE